MRHMMKHDKYKRDMFHACFEITYFNAVDNLNTNDNLSYSLAKERLIDLSPKQQPKKKEEMPPTSHSASTAGTNQKSADPDKDR